MSSQQGEHEARKESVVCESTSAFANLAFTNHAYHSSNTAFGQRPLLQNGNILVAKHLHENLELDKNSYEEHFRMY